MVHLRNLVTLPHEHFSNNQRRTLTNKNQTNEKAIIKLYQFVLSLSSCDNTDPDNPYDAQFNSSGCLECDNYTAGESFIVGGVR